MMVVLGSVPSVDTIQRRFLMFRIMWRQNISALLDSRVHNVTNNVSQEMLWWSTNLDFTSKNNSSPNCSQTWTSESSSWCQEGQTVCGNVTRVSTQPKRGRAWSITLRAVMSRAVASLAIIAPKFAPLVMQCRCMSSDSTKFNKCDLTFVSWNILVSFRFFWGPWCHDRCLN